MTPKMANILIGITDPDECALAVFALRFAGHRVTRADTAEQLIARLQQTQPDLVLVEANFGGLEDAALREAIEKEAWTSSILYVGDQAPSDHAARRRVAIDYLRKPISADSLTRKVNEVLKRK